MNKVYYLYYIICMYILSFLVYVLMLASDNVVIYVLIEVFLFCLFYLKRSVFYNYYKFERINVTFHQKINDQKPHNLIVAVKEFLLFNFLLLLYYLNFNVVILFLFISDYVVKVTLGVSLLEYYYNRRIIFKVGNKGERDED